MFLRRSPLHIPSVISSRLHEAADGERSLVGSADSGVYNGPRHGFSASRAAVRWFAIASIGFAAGVKWLVSLTSG
jgi:hypothetical protein